MFLVIDQDYPYTFPNVTDLLFVSKGRNWITWGDWLSRRSRQPGKINGCFPYYNSLGQITSQMHIQLNCEHQRCHISFKCLFFAYINYLRLQGLRGTTYVKLKSLGFFRLQGMAGQRGLQGVVGKAGPQVSTANCFKVNPSYSAISSGDK